MSEGNNTKPPESRDWLERISTPRGVALLAALSILMIVLAALGIWYVLNVYPVGPKSTIQLEPPASMEELIETYPELEPILTNSELDSVYKEFFVVYKEGGAEAALDLARKRGILSQDNEIRMTLELDISDSAELVAQLEERGIKVTAASGNAIDIAIPVTVIEAAIKAGNPGILFQDLAALEHIVRIRLPRIGLQDAGSIEIESLTDIGANLWHGGGFTGDGIKIGVLDMGFNDYVPLLGTDLPENVTAQSFIYGREIDATSTAHGTKCAEVIHDVAPGAELVFAAYETDVERIQAVEWLLTQDVDIISNSTGSIYGPMDGTGDIARMANDVVDGGVFWVNSAGNSGDTHYRGVFTDTDGNGFHEFTPDDEMMGFVPNGFVVMVLNWDDWGVGLQDFDLAILDQDQNIIATSENIQDGPEDDPAELLTYDFDDNEVYFIAFFGSNFSRPVTFDFFAYDAELEYITPEYSITTPADAENTVAVGATYWEDDVVEYYSSRGPSVDGRVKPDISAPAGVSVAVADQPFFGTSASTPHVAGAAALVLEAFPDFQPHEVQAYLQNRAIDLGPSGPDNDYGYGRLWLGEAPAPEAVQPTPISEAPPTATDVPEEVPIVETTVIPTPVLNPIETPTPSDVGTGSIGVTELLLICACVTVPAILGLGGIVLLVGIWMYRRSSTPQPTPPQKRTPGAAPAQVERVAANVPPEAGKEFCPRCQKPHSLGARFCSSCGYELASPNAPQEETRFCNQCGAALRPSAKFCSNCGHKN